MRTRPDRPYLDAAFYYAAFYYAASGRTVWPGLPDEDELSEVLRTIPG